MPTSTWSRNAGRRLSKGIGVLSVMLFLVGVPDAFAQGAGNSTVTGTVVDNTGVVPGAIVTLTEDGHEGGPDDTVQRNGRVPVCGAAARDGTRSRSHSQASSPCGRQLQRRRGRDSRPGQADARARQHHGSRRSEGRSHARSGELQRAPGPRSRPISWPNIQMKGRDIYGLLAVIPGVQDSNLSRDFTSWTSANNITINGAPVTSNNIMIDGIAQRDEYGTNAFVNPNIDAVAEVQVVASGYTAENGRSNGGLVNYVTKSGTNRFADPAGTPRSAMHGLTTTTSASAQNQPKPLYRVNIGGFSVGGPVVIPEGDRQPDVAAESVLLRIAGIHEGRAADTDLDGELSDGPRAHRRFFTDASDDGRRELRRHPADHRLQDGPAVPGQHHSGRSHQPDRAEAAEPAASSRTATSRLERISSSTRTSSATRRRNTTASTTCTAWTWRGTTSGGSTTRCSRIRKTTSASTSSALASASRTTRCRRGRRPAR